MKITTIFVFFIALFFSVPTNAMIETTTVTPTESIEKQKSTLKKEFNTSKKMAKWEKFLKKAGVDFNDPVDKWMWFWIFGWGGALLLNLLYWTGVWGFWYLSGLLWAAGTVCLVIWIVKKFAK